MPKKITVAQICENGKEYIPAITRNDHEKIIQLEKIAIAVYHDFINKDYQDNKLQSLKSFLPLDQLDRSFEGRINDYTAVSHHVWLTNMAKPKDMVIYVSDVLKYNQYNPNKVTGAIDHQENAFIKSILNLEKGAQESKLPLSEDKFYHIIWTNFSREDLVQHPELKDLRKICGIDSTAKALPKFIVLNIEEVMDAQDINKIKDQADPAQPLPQSILKGLLQVQQDLLSVRSELNGLYDKKMFASMSDIVRVAAVKDIGGIYFDLDYNLYDQSQLHKNKQYNLFDLMKHYDSILGKEGQRLCNAIISSAQPNSSVLKSIWETVKNNIQNPDSVDYIKYSTNNFDKIICQTGPIAATIGFLKSAGEYDIALDFPALYYNEFKRSAHQVKLNGSVGAIGYDTWGGSWLECKYNKYKSYKYFEVDTGSGITEAEWEATWDI
jgi:hypothetical protein